jgi:hypothetical protein
MKKTAVVLLVAVVAVTATAQAEISVRVDAGVPRHRMVSSPPTIRFDVAPLFLAPSRLGFYVGVDTPYDIIFSSDYYYLYYGNSWHRSRHHNGPWVELPYYELPPAIRKHRIEQIRSYREREYRTYRNNRDNYRGRPFQPEHERRGEIKEERRNDREERREQVHERVERREQVRDREERREHLRDREERREHRRD